MGLQTQVTTQTRTFAELLQNQQNQSQQQTRILETLCARLAPESAPPLPPAAPQRPELAVNLPDPTILHPTPTPSSSGDYARPDKDPGPPVYDGTQDPNDYFDHVEDLFRAKRTPPEAQLNFAIVAMQGTARFLVK